jgi:hypothetical protein
MGMTEYVSRLPDGTLVRWKPLNWAEYRNLIKTFGESLDGAAGWLLIEATAASCFLDQEQDGEQVVFDDLYAGTVYTIGRQILELTGFIPTVDKVKEALGHARERLSSDWYESAMALICVAFHKDESEIRQWDLQKFMDYCARIEFATGKEISVTDSSESDNESKKFITTPDGRKIPVLTKRDLARKQMQLDGVLVPGL